MKLNKNIRTIIIIVVVFFIWAGLSLYRTISKNPEWFEAKSIASDEGNVEREEIETTDKKEFTYALSWSKYGNRWVCVNIAGNAEIVLGEEYTKVTDFCNSMFAIVEDESGIKTLIDRSGDCRLCEYSYTCDEIITNDFHASMAVATQKVKENGKEQIGYGIIGDTLGWIKPPSTKNEYLKEFTKGIDGGVLTNEKGDKLYFHTTGKIVENVDEFLFYDATTAMYRKGTDIYLIDKSGENERVSMKNIAKAAEWTEGVIYCELTDGKKVFNNINGDVILDVSHLDIINEPRFINEYAGILFNTDEGTKYTVIDIKGNMQFDPRPGEMCDTLTAKVYRVNDAEGLRVIDEKGKTLFNVDKSITYFTNGYALKDEKDYVTTDGTVLKITKEVGK